MKTETIAALFPAALKQLAAYQVDVLANPPDWRKSLQRAIDEGAFIRLQIGFAAGGMIDARLDLVARDGSTATELSVAEFPPAGEIHA